MRQFESATAKMIAVAKNLAVGLVSLLAFQMTAHALQPGLWKSTTTFRLNGIPMPNSHDENCFSPSQAKDTKSAIEEELKKKGCSLDNWILKNQKLTADLNCNNKDVEAHGKLTGDITQTKFEIKGNAKGKYKRFLPSVAAVTLSGERVGTCTK